MLKAPYPYFGGKATIAKEVWARFGNVPNFRRTLPWFRCCRAVVSAGWWCWGLCQWIGRGWCSGEWWGRGNENNAGDGINIRDEERGGKLPHLYRGRGVHRKLPHLGDAGMGECARRHEVLLQWIGALSDRIRNVRVCCGDWKRVLGPSPTFRLGTTAILLDPPYSEEAGRDNALYSHEDLDVAHDVRDWCLSNGDNKELRIALCGYEGEGHEELERAGWEVLEWKAHGGYAMQSEDGDGRVNKHRERVWFSPHCLRPSRQRTFLESEAYW